MCFHPIKWQDCLIINISRRNQSIFSCPSLLILLHLLSHLLYERIFSLTYQHWHLFVVCRASAITWVLTFMWLEVMKEGCVNYSKLMLINKSATQCRDLNWAGQPSEHMPGCIFSLIISNKWCSNFWICSWSYFLSLDIMTHHFSSRYHLPDIQQRSDIVHTRIYKLNMPTMLNFQWIQLEY